MYEIVPCACPSKSIVAFIAVSIFLGSFKASKILNTSTPFTLAFSINLITTSSA